MIIGLQELVIEPVVALPQHQKLHRNVSGSSQGGFRAGISVMVSGERAQTRVWDSVEKMLPTLAVCKRALAGGGEEGRLLFMFLSMVTVSGCVLPRSTLLTVDSLGYKITSQYFDGRWVFLKIMTMTSRDVFYTMAFSRKGYMIHIRKRELTFKSLMWHSLLLAICYCPYSYCCHSLTLLSHSFVVLVPVEWK